MTDLRVVGRNSRECTKQLNRLMHYGVHLISRKESVDLEVKDYKALLPVFYRMYQMDEENRKNEQKKGIERAKKEGGYAGRKRKEVDEELLTDLIGKFQNGKLELEEVLEITGLSRSTFYRRMKAFRERKFE